MTEQKQFDQEKLSEIYQDFLKGFHVPLLDMMCRAGQPIIVSLVVHSEGINLFQVQNSFEFYRLSGGRGFDSEDEAPAKKPSYLG